MSRGRNNKRALPVIVRLLAVVVVGSILASTAIYAIAFEASNVSGAASTGGLQPIVLSPLAVRSIISDKNGGEMALLYADEDREEVTLDKVPAAVQTSVIGIEDRDFYLHRGVNVRSAFRALFSNIQAGDIQQGGSTITQQLIKNSVLGTEQTLSRKTKEALLAIRLEDQMTKKQILERYLNTVYLGHGAYGMQAGAETYFDTTVDKLGWPEAAMLTALIRNPVGYDPISYPTLARKRRALVARRLLAEKLITASQAAEINAEPLPTRTFSRAAASESTQLAGANYFSEEVKQQLLSLPELGATPQDRYDAVFKGGLRVTTTYDPEAQKLAEKAVATLPDTKGKFIAALASVDPKDGAVRAVVGGTDFDTQKFNFATQGWRQPGSSFKFFTLMAAFEYGGDVPADSISGVSPCKFPDPGSPKGIYVANNSEPGGRYGTITSQTQASSNCAFLRLAQSVGLDKVAALADAMGITTLNPKVDADGKPVNDSSGNPAFVEGPVPTDVLSMPIGSKEVHPLEMAAAYATAANDGVYNPAYFISKVTDAAGKVLYVHHPVDQRVVSAQTARLVTQALVANVKAGTGTGAQLGKQPAAGKTGTTQDNADVWFVGFTPRLATAVWIGSPTDRSKVVIRGVTQFGAKLPAQIWKAFMQPYHASRDVVPFLDPAPTRRGRAIKYTNKYDKGGSCTSSTCARKPTTTLPGGAPAAATPPASGVAPATQTPDTTPPAAAGGNP